MQYSINQLYHLLYKRVDDIHAIFQNFFGSEHVDHSRADAHNIKLCIAHTLIEKGIKGLSSDDFDQPLDIPPEVITALQEQFSHYKSIFFVWWPSVTVSNEHDKSITIQDLYARVDVCMDGTIPYENKGFLLNRATYPVKQFLSNYMHSHIQRIPKEDFCQFMPPCLGHGPIQGTINTLKTEYSEASWMLFCQELSLYVTVESLEGGPWKRLEEVGFRHRLYTHSGYHSQMGSFCAFTRLFSPDRLAEFVKYYLSHGHLSLSFKGGHYLCGMPYHEYIIDISNSFIEFYNTHLATTATRLNSCFLNNLLSKAVMSGGQFYAYDSQSTHSPSDLSSYQGKFILSFKGKDIHLSIIPDAKEDTLPVTIVNSGFALYVLNHILKVINYRYTHEYKDTNGQGGSTASAPPSSRVLYL